MTVEAIRRTGFIAVIILLILSSGCGDKVAPGRT